MGNRFDISYKNPSLDSLTKWRKGVFALNAARRFRHTAKVETIRQVHISSMACVYFYLFQTICNVRWIDCIVVL